MTISDRRFDRLLDLIYDAATEPEQWRAVLIEIADLTGCQGGVMHGIVRLDQVVFDYNGRLSEECNRAFKERHVENPWTASLQRKPVGSILLSDEVVPLAALRRTLLFEEVLRPQDQAHCALISLAGTEDLLAAVCLGRSQRQGPLPVEGRRLLEKLVPHMRRSLDLGFRIEGYRALQRADCGVLDRLSVGVILLDRRQRVVYANAAARALDSDKGPLRLRNAIVAAQSPSHSQRLNELVRMALMNAPAGSMSIPRRGDASRLTILVSSVRGRDIGRFADLRMPDAAVLLFIIDPANRGGIPLAWIMDAYGLTPAEARVALCAASGATIPETARRLNVSVNTVKTHLAKVFAKTGTSRKTELARLMGSVGLLRGHAAEGKDGS
jgi:DNA-binding CsgD family transcriptional regulator/PAS domain-containing protein